MTHEFVTRVEIPAKYTYGWQVRFRRQNHNATEKKKSISKFFSDHKHGNKQKALKAAIEWRNEKLPDIPEAWNPREFSAAARSSLDAPGIHLHVRRVKRPTILVQDKSADDEKKKKRVKRDYGNLHPYLHVNWKKNGRRYSRCLSLEKQDLRKTLWKAVKIRGEAEGLNVKEQAELFGRAYHKALDLLKSIPTNS